MDRINIINSLNEIIDYESKINEQNKMVEKIKSKKPNYSHLVAPEKHIEERKRADADILSKYSKIDLVLIIVGAVVLFGSINGMTLSNSDTVRIIFVCVFIFGLVLLAAGIVLKIFIKKKDLKYDFHKKVVAKNKIEASEKEEEKVYKAAKKEIDDKFYKKQKEKLLPYQKQIKLLTSKKNKILSDLGLPIQMTCKVVDIKTEFESKKSLTLLEAFNNANERAKEIIRLRLIKQDAEDEERRHYNEIHLNCRCCLFKRTCNKQDKVADTRNCTGFVPGD